MYLYALTEQLTQFGLNELALAVCNLKHEIDKEISKLATVTSRNLTCILLVHIKFAERMAVAKAEAG